MSKKSKSKQPNNASHLPPFDKKKGSMQVVIEISKAKPGNEFKMEFGRSRDRKFLPLLSGG